MGDSLFLFMLLNSMVFSLIFWILTFMAKYFYQDKYSNYKLNFYECGFKSVTALRLNISIQFVLISAFLIIYDGEFLMLYPAIFNISVFTSIQLWLVLFFIFLLFLALAIDYIYASLDWHM